MISKPDRTSGGVIQYDFGKTVQEGRFVRTGSLNGPPTVLLGAVNTLQAKNRMEEPELTKNLAEMSLKYPKMQEDGTYPGVGHDRLFEAPYNHQGDYHTCASCDRLHMVSRSLRSDGVPAVHYGLVASGNRVMRDGVTRQRLQQELDVLCFEMEAAGWMDDFPCLVNHYTYAVCQHALWMPYPFDGP